MATIKEFRQACETKGLRFEVNKIWEFSDGYTKMEIGVNYKGWTWAWFSYTFTGVENGDEDLFFRGTYNQVMGAEDKSWKREYSVTNQILNKNLKSTLPKY